MSELKMYPVKFPIELLDTLLRESEATNIPIRDLIVQKVQNSYSLQPNTEQKQDTPEPVNQNQFIFEQTPNA